MHKPRENPRVNKGIISWSMLMISCFDKENYTRVVFPIWLLHCKQTKIFSVLIFMKSIWFFMPIFQIKVIWADKKVNSICFETTKLTKIQSYMCRHYKCCSIDLVCHTFISLIRSTQYFSFQVCLGFTKACQWLIAIVTTHTVLPLMLYLWLIV